MTNTSNFTFAPVSESSSQNNLSSVWFGMIIVGVVALIIGFAAGYSLGFGEAITQVEKTQTVATSYMFDK